MTAPAHALVLAAGFGTRLRPLTLARAKPAIPVAGDPIVRRILTWLVGHDVIDIVLNLHYLPDTIAAVVGDGGDLGARVRYSWEQPAILGSAGGPRHALGMVGADTFFVVNGDTLTDVDLSEMADRHARSGALVTMALVPNRNPGRYGGVRVADDDRVAGFVRRGSTEPSHLFVGVQIVRASVFQSLAPNTPADTVGGVYDELLRTRPGSIRAWVGSGRFWDVGTPEDYWTTSQAFMSAGGETANHGREVRISPSARVTRSVLWDDVEVESDVIVDECVVTDGVRLTAGSTYRRSLVVRPKGTDQLVVAPLA